MKLSVVVPCFNEEEALPLYMKAMRDVALRLEETEIEYVFVDDGSKDGTLSLLRNYHRENENVRYLSFSRNFGKEAALYAGLKSCTGEYVCIMDVDLQDPPELIVDMLEKVKKGDCDCCATRRCNRKGEPVIRSFFAHRFYDLVNIGNGPEIPSGARDFRVMTRKMCDAVLSMSEYNRFSKGLFSWVGFKTEWITFENVARAKGTTKWSFGKLFYYAVDGLTSHTVKPLEIAGWLGVFFFLLSIIGMIVVIVRKLLFGDPVAGWPSLVVIILFCSGIQLFCTGIIGMYLARTYQEVKRRPIYILKESEKDMDFNQ